MPDRITDFISALQDEIDAVRKSRASSYHLTDGQLTGKIGHNWLYSFTSTAFIRLEDDCPGQIDIGGQLYDCAIVSIDGLEVNISLTSPCGSEIGSARLITNRGQILLRLLDKFKEARKTPQIFKLAEDVFCGRVKPFGGSSKAKYSFNGSAPDLSQKEAIANSFSNSLAVVWGPPGTGKTRTIAQIAEAHINAGRRVLLVSHANNAVDAAMKAIAAQMQSLYSAGKIIRVGLPRDPALQNLYPLTILEQQVASTNAPLVQEKLNIESRCKPLSENLSRCRNLDEAGKNVRNLEKEIQRPEKLIAQQNRFQQVLANLQDAQRQLAAAQDYLDPGLRETHTRDLSVRVSTLKSHAVEIEDGLNNLTAAAQNLHQELAAANAQLADLMEETGLSPADVDEHIQTAQKKLASFNAQIEQIEHTVISSRQNAIASAQVVGTTLSKLYLSNLLSEQVFDILIVDEASMVPMPHLYWALTKATIGVTLVGDFNQLPPIALADTTVAKRWLAGSIFDELAINSVEKARPSKIVSLLDTQYRMAPEIASIASELFYEGLLKSAESTYQIGITDSIFANSRVVLVDTSSVDPWCVSPPSGSRLNIYSAGLAVCLAQRLLDEHSDISLGIATPYKPQAMLIATAMAESGHKNKAQVSTIHGFQGGESSVIIFDCVDGKGSKKSMLDDDFGEGKKTDVKFLLNVALTRARALIIIIVNKQYFLDTQNGTTFTKFLDKLTSSALKIDARLIDNSYIARSLDSEPTSPRARIGSDLTNGQTKIFNEKDFWTPFRHDLNQAKEMVLIVSPFLTQKRSEYFAELFKNIIARGVKLTVITRPANEHNREHMFEESEAVIDMLESIGVTVIQRSKTHQKIIIVDNRICWEGSLNVLSQRSSLEHMRRLEGKALVAEVRRSLSF